MGSKKRYPHFLRVFVNILISKLMTIEEMLNRERAPAKGLWNGLGGKIKDDETPLECVCREVFEETEIKIEDANIKGT